MNRRSALKTMAVGTAVAFGLVASEQGAQAGHYFYRYRFRYAVWRGRRRLRWRYHYRVRVWRR